MAPIVTGRWRVMRNPLFRKKTLTGLAKTCG